jgi:hypothetical protein
MALSQLDQHVRDAVKFFWTTRAEQAQRQGSASGMKDQGARAAVTGGAQMDGFVRFVRDLLYERGLPLGAIHHRGRIEIPGWYRSEKKWDLLVIVEGKLVAAIEFKSQIGPSFGNNFNNRTEESIGSAADLWAAYREGAFKPSARPWLGYLMMLEDCSASTKPVRSCEPFFRVFPEFVGSSYKKRYEILLTKLVRERLYDAACLMLSNSETGQQDIYQELSPELSFQNFAASLLGRAKASGSTVPEQDNSTQST